VRHDVQERFYVIDNTKRTQLVARKTLRRLVDKPRTLVSELTRPIRKVR
jgi:hypothetical protein